MSKRQGRLTNLWGRQPLYNRDLMALLLEFEQFCVRWREKASGYIVPKLSDPFDKFFTLWVLFNALYTEVAWRTGHAGIGDDRAGQEILLQYLGAIAFTGSLNADRDVTEALTSVEMFLQHHCYYSTSHLTARLVLANLWRTRGFGPA
jgi:hypothetical protein